jgi:DNA-binding CsgD family transcriptional regulator/pimeloyl-ACP methyl ester carboxylesterase
MGDIYALDGSRHIASVVRVPLNGQQEDMYRFSVWKIMLPSDAEVYIRKNLLLTNAEIEILVLLLERFSIGTISEYRKCTLNTTRTHINNIKKKFKSNSLTDVISSTHEIIALHHQKRDVFSDAPDRYVPVQGNSNISKLPTGKLQVEYSRYGSIDGRPLIILHSVEYGISPPKDFVAEATAAGYCVYVPLRAGFGRTSSAGSIGLAAVLLSEFIKTLELENVKIIAFSTSSPTAIKLLETNDKIKSIVFVNYGFDTKDKIAHIKPVWLKGLLKFALGSQESFNFAFRMSKRMLSLVGYKTFYRKIYQSCEEDLLFLEENLDVFKASANLLLSVKPESLRDDLVAAFQHNPTLDQAALKNDNIVAVFGEHTHGISLAPIKTATENLGIPFYVMAKSGRNCVYQNPMQFFQIIDANESLRG